MNHAVTKYIDVCYHYIRVCVTDGSVGLKIIRMNGRIVDVLTKSLINTKHKWLCLMLEMETTD